jgi:hypothetical protein
MVCAAVSLSARGEKSKIFMITIMDHESWVMGDRQRERNLCFFSSSTTCATLTLFAFVLKKTEKKAKGLWGYARMSGLGNISEN